MKLGWAGVGALLASGTTWADVVTTRGGGEGERGGKAGAGLAGAQPGFYRFRIGRLEAIAFNDGAVTSPVAQSRFGREVPVEETVALLRDAFLPITHLHNQFNVLLVRMGAELVLFDSGCGTTLGPAAGRLRAQMAAAGVAPEQVTAVILSHAHRDHFGGLIDAETKQLVFRNATHFVGRGEFDFWTGTSPHVSTLRLPESGREGMVKGARGALEAEALRGKWQLIAPGERLVDGLEIVDAAGHTPGHLGFMISSGGDQLLHFVDAANHHVLAFVRPDWPFVFDVQPEVAMATRRRLLDRAVEDRLRVFGAHMPFPALGHVKRRGVGAEPGERGGFEYVIEPWVAG